MLILGKVGILSPARYCMRGGTGSKHHKIHLWLAVACEGGGGLALRPNVGFIDPKSSRTAQ